MDLLLELLTKFMAKLFAHLAVWEPIKEFGLSAWVVIVGVVALIIGGIFSFINLGKQAVAGKKKSKRQ